MNVAYACNRHFLHHVMVSLYSLLTNGRKERPVMSFKSEETL